MCKNTPHPQKSSSDVIWGCTIFQSRWVSEDTQPFGGVNIMKRTHQRMTNITGSETIKRRWLLVATTWWVAPSLPFKRLRCLKQKLATVLLRQIWPVVEIWFGKLKTHLGCYSVDNKMSKWRCFCIRWTGRRDSRCWGQAPWRYGRVICTRPCPTELIRLFRTLSSFIREPSSYSSIAKALNCPRFQQ